METSKFARAAFAVAAMLGISGCASVPAEQLAAAQAKVAPSVALTPALRNGIVELIMKHDANNIYFFGRPTYDYARISDLMFSRPLGGIMAGTAEVSPYYCVELRAKAAKAYYLISVERTSETGYHLRVSTKQRSPICYVPQGQGQDLPELLLRKNAPTES